MTSSRAHFIPVQSVLFCGVGRKSMKAANHDEARVIESYRRVRPEANAAKAWANRLATMAVIAAALYLLSILVTGGHERWFGPITFDATKAWPAIPALLVLLLVRLR
jgi:hypothetical protein